MERNKKNLKDRGITLVALIITIIVMLILVAVTVTVAVQSNLIEVAETATSKYKNSQEDQIQANKVGVEGGQYGTLEQYACEHSYTNRVCTKCGAVEILTFTVEGKEYSVPATYTWQQFVEDERYNTAGWVTDGNYIYKSEGDKQGTTVLGNYKGSGVGGSSLGNCGADELISDDIDDFENMGGGYFQWQTKIVVTDPWGDD